MGTLSDLEEAGVEALLEYLLQYPDQTAPMPNAGLIVKRTGFTHPSGFKKWLLTKEGVFEVLPPDLVRAVPAKAVPAHAPGFSSALEEDALEKTLVAFLTTLGRKAHLGSHLGMFCKEELGLDTHGKLRRFVALRPHVFALDDQFVGLTGAAQSSSSRAAARPAPRASAEEEMPPQGKRVVTVRPPPRAVAAPPGFEDTPRAHVQIAEGALPSSSTNAELLKAFAELQAQYKKLQLEVDAIKSHLKLSPNASLSNAPQVNGTAHTAPPNGQLEGLASNPPKTLVLGGHDGLGWLDSSVCLSGLEWSEVAALPSPTAFASAGNVYGHVLLFGGCHDGNKWLNNVLRRSFNDLESGGKWEVMAPMSVARGSLSVSFCSGAFYAMGGGLPSAQLPLVERYDAIVDRWTTVQPLQTPRFAPASAVVQGSLFCVGGMDGQKYLNTVEAYDAREGKWSTLSAKMDSKRGSLAACAVHDHQILAVGGFDSVQSVATCELLDTRACRWRKAAPMSRARTFGAAVTSPSSGEVWAFGGLEEDMKKYADGMERYSVRHDSWQILEPSPMRGPCERRAFFGVTVDQQM